MPANDREVFETITSTEDTEVYIGFIAYAIFAHHKREWTKLYEKDHNGQAATQQDIDQWISNITDLQFNEMKEEAARFFDSAARDYLKDEMEDEKKEAVNQSILSEVKGFTSPWRHLGIALLMAVLAPIILGGIIFFFGIFDSSFPIHIIWPTK